MANAEKQLSRLISLAVTVAIAPSGVLGIGNTDRDPDNQQHVHGSRHVNSSQGLEQFDDANRKRPLREVAREQPKVVKTLHEQALDFIAPDPKDAHDAKTKSDALGEVANSESSIVATEKKKNGVYQITYFGTSSDEQIEQGYSDAGQDNSTLKYEDKVRARLSSQSKAWKKALRGKSGEALERSIKYFTAGAGEQYEPGSKVKITAPNGNVVAAVVGDEGPALEVQESANKAKFDTSWDTWVKLGKPVKVKVEPVPEKLEKYVKLGRVEMRPVFSRAGARLLQR